LPCFVLLCFALLCFALLCFALFCFALLYFTVCWYVKVRVRVHLSVSSRLRGLRARVKVRVRVHVSVSSRLRGLRARAQKLGKTLTVDRCVSLVKYENSGISSHCLVFVCISVNLWAIFQLFTLSVKSIFELCH